MARDGRSNRGRPRISVRFDPAVIEEVEQTIARLQDTSARPPWDFSDFVRKALTEKLQKMQRSRSWRRRKKELRRLREEREAARQRDAA
jgi:hypothetical protein